MWRTCSNSLYWPFLGRQPCRASVAYGWISKSSSNFRFTASLYLRLTLYYVRRKLPPRAARLAPQTHPERCNASRYRSSHLCMWLSRPCCWSPQARQWHFSQSLVPSSTGANTNQIPQHFSYKLISSDSYLRKVLIELCFIRKIRSWSTLVCKLFTELGHLSLTQVLYLGLQTWFLHLLRYASLYRGCYTRWWGKW